MENPAEHRHPDVECQEALHELYVFLDGELTAERKARVTVHLETCVRCLEAFEFEAELKAVIHDRCRDEPPVHLQQRVADALRELDRRWPPSRHH